MRAHLSELLITCGVAIALTACGGARFGDGDGGGDCTRDSDCAGGNLCIDGVCLSLCDSQDDCAAGEACVDEFCVSLYDEENACDVTCEDYDLTCGRYLICDLEVSCGTCGANQVCEAGSCIDLPCEEDCVCEEPRRDSDVCDDADADCGVVLDACDVEVVCGACDASNPCTSVSCESNSCVTVDLDGDACVAGGGGDGTCDAGACVPDPIIEEPPCDDPCSNDGARRCTIQPDGDADMDVCPDLPYGTPLCEGREICTDGCWQQTDACDSDQVCNGGSCS